MFAIGCDFVEIDRVTRALKRNDRFKKMVFSPAEIDYCTGLNRDKIESYAAFFAAKEAFLKAIGTGFRGGSLSEISVVHDVYGKPSLHVSGFFAEKLAAMSIIHIQVTLSHSQNTAMAIVLLS